MSRGVRRTFRVLLSASLRCDGIGAGLILILTIYGFAFRLGWPEALAAAVVGVLGLEYYFLPLRGFGVAGFQQWLTLSIFLLVSLLTSRIAAGLRRQNLENQRLRADLHDFLHICQAVVECRTEDEILARIDVLRKALHADGLTVYEKTAGIFSESGRKPEQVTEASLGEVAASGVALCNPAYSITPMRAKGELWGSMAATGVLCSQELLQSAGNFLAKAILTVRLADSEGAVALAGRYEELKSQISDEVIHEIRGSLHCIGLATASLLSERPCSPLQQRQMLRAISEELERIERTGARVARQKQRPEIFPPESFPAHTI